MPLIRIPGSVDGVLRADWQPRCASRGSCIPRVIEVRRSCKAIPTDDYPLTLNRLRLWVKSASSATLQR